MYVCPFPRPSQPCKKSLSAGKKTSWERFVFRTIDYENDSHCKLSSILFFKASNRNTKEPADNEETEVARIKVDEIDPETSSNVDEESNDEHQGITIELQKKYD